MRMEYHKTYSHELERDMEYKVYGERGKPVILFPSQDGRFYQYEDFGIIESCQAFIEQGQIKAFCVDSIDAETWSAYDKFPHERIQKHEAYTRYIMKELLPSIDATEQKVLFAGVSLGAGHAANFFFRFPSVADSLIALSGTYSTRPFLGDYMDADVYFNSVIDYLGNMTDERLLACFRKSKIAICCGQGAYEELMLRDIHIIKDVLAIKNIPAFVDIWGPDVNHDWCWWRKQMPYFLNWVLQAE